MIRSRIHWKTAAAIDVSFAVCAEVVAIWFLWSYSQVTLLRLRSTVDHVYLATIHKYMIDEWQSAWIVPLVTVILGVILARMKSVLGIRILCYLSWLFALALVCFVVIAWENAYLPVIRLGD